MNSSLTGSFSNTIYAFKYHLLCDHYPQWIAHILKWLHLLDESKRKRDTDGMVYAINPVEVRDIMRRYDVSSIFDLKD